MIPEDPTERFLYWIKERHAIHLRKERGEPKPWTTDPVMREYFFTNPYRENDKTTVWFRENIREPFAYHPDVDQVMATIIFRWFNYIPTGEILLDQGLLVKWSKAKTLRILGKIRDRKEKVFTGAFMINSPAGKPKLEAICERIQNVWVDRKNLTAKIVEVSSLQEAHEALTAYDGLGGFMAYEVVCDLRYTNLLRDATDVLTWCNPGPGAIRGLYRIAEEPTGKANNSSSPAWPKDWLKRMKKLLTLARKKIHTKPRLEMREIEHSLCEFDKYERARLGDGKMKRRYNGYSD